MGRPISLFSDYKQSEVDYRKVSPGGMFSSKRYFDFPEIQSIEESRERLDKDKTRE